MPFTGPRCLREKVFTSVIREIVEVAIEKKCFFPTTLAVDLGTVRGLLVDCDRLVGNHCAMVFIQVIRRKANAIKLYEKKCTSEIDMQHVK